jgi:hypothetical protein
MAIPNNKYTDEHCIQTEEKVRKIRKSATITPFGVGSIYDSGDESFIAMDTTYWDKNAPIIRLPRLEVELGVNHFCMAPTPADKKGSKTQGVPYHRFPQWLFCNSCRLMSHWSHKNEKKNQRPTCTECLNKHLSPMRFVAACAGGHLADVPWREWAHSYGKNWSQKQCRTGGLSFEAKKKGGGLESLFVTCKICGASRSFQDLPKKDALKSIIEFCRNKQPWEQTAPSTRLNCSQFPQVIQRGASNLYFPKIQAAIDIPSLHASQLDTVSEKVKQDPKYKFLKDSYFSTSTPENNPSVKLIAEQIANRVKCNESTVINTVKMELSPPSQIKIQMGPTGLLREEWKAFLTTKKTVDLNSNFIIEKTNTGNFLNTFDKEHPFNSLASKLGTIVLAKRLREVRVLQGFERVKPGETEFSEIKPSLDTPLNWLPGVEVFGEGIFITLNESKLADWESKNKNTISKRLSLMEKNRSKCNFISLASFSARFVLLHTFSHLIIRQLGFDCGYSSASLRERIYSATPDSQNEGMAGVLIYTADGDSEGALGGLVREGQPERLFPMLATALEKAKWCSGDPICKELETQGLNGLNRAACHACSLIGETSCTSGNVMLDRALLTEGGVGFSGYFDNNFV